MTGLEVLAVAGIVTGIAAGITGAVSGITAAAQAKQQGQLQQKLYDYNAEIAKRNAQVATEKANYEEQRLRRNSARFIGNQGAAFAASGSLSGSAFDVLGFSALEAEMDALAIRYEGQINAASFLNSANQSTYQGKMAKNYFDGQATNQGLNAAGTLLGGFSEAALGFANAGGSLPGMTPGKNVTPKGGLGLLSPSEGGIAFA